MSLRSIYTRHADPTFEKLMSIYKHYIKVVSIRTLIISSPTLTLPLSHLSHPSIYQRFNLNKGPTHFLRSFPDIFTLSPDPTTLFPIVGMTPLATQIAACESEVSASVEAIRQTVGRLVRILRMSRERAVPMRAVFRVWRELGLPDDLEERVLKENEAVFRVRDNPKEKGTHILELIDDGGFDGFVPMVGEWRRERQKSGDERLKKVDEMELRYGFKQGFPPGMKLTKNFRSKLKAWQRLPYVGPYQAFDIGPKRSKDVLMRMEKRAVGIVHEFLSLTVEKMAEVEQVSQFRKWFGIDLNVRDLFLDHPGIFYLSTKGKRHTVFLREAYEKGRLIEPNPIYDARRELLELVAMRRRGVVFADDEKVGKNENGSGGGGGRRRRWLGVLRI